MPREQLKALAADVERLLLAGSATAAGDEGLRRREAALRELSAKVPALAPIAEAAGRVTRSTPAQSSRALLDLLLIVRQVRGSLAAPGIEGELVPIEQTGTWRTKAGASEVHSLAWTLLGTGSGRLEELKEASARGTTTDLRLVEPLLDSLDDGYVELADLVAETILPEFGPTILPDLERGLDLKGRAADARRLLAICEIEARSGVGREGVGVALCRRAVREGSPPLRVQAMRCYPKVAPEEAEVVALELLSRGVDDAGRETKTAGKEAAREVRSAALEALAGSKNDAALEALLSAAADEYVVWARAAHTLQVMPHTGVWPRVAAELTRAAEEASADVAKPPRSAKKAAGRTAPAKREKAAAQAAERTCRLIRLMSSLASTRAKEANALIRPLLAHGSSDVREAALKALASHGAPDDLEAAATLLDDAKVWRAAMDAAWKLPPRSRYDRLAPLLGDPPTSKKISPKAEALLGLFEEEISGENRRDDWDRRWTTLLKPWLDGPKRPEIALALALVQGRKAVPELLRVLEASVAKDECGVVEALGYLRAREAVKPMLALIPGQKAHHYCVHDALKLIGDTSILDRLRTMQESLKGSLRLYYMNNLISHLEQLASAD